jgi:hypothetical protein
MEILKRRKAGWRVLVEGSVRVQTAGMEIRLSGRKVRVSRLTELTPGAQVDRITPGSPAADHLKEGDIIVSIDDDVITGVERLRRILDEKRGKEVAIVISRDGKSQPTERVKLRKSGSALGITATTMIWMRSGWPGRRPLVPAGKEVIDPASRGVTTARAWPRGLNAAVRAAGRQFRRGAMELTGAQAADLYRRVAAALAGLPPDVLADLRAAAQDVRLDTRYRPPRGCRRVFCAYFDPDARRVVLRACLVAQFPAEAVGPLVAQTCAHAVLWRRGGEWESGAAADALARSWGFDLAPGLSLLSLGTRP